MIKAEVKWCVYLRTLHCPLSGVDVDYTFS